MPYGHSPRNAATTHLMRHLVPRVTKKKKKPFYLLWSSWNSTVTKESRGSWRDWRDQLKTNLAGQTRSLLRWAQKASASLTRIAEPFNAFNNISDGYKTIYTDHWKHNKSSITRQEALPKKEVNANHNG